MTMTDDLAPTMKPQDTTNFLLGGMQKQLEAIAAEQKEARGAGESFRTEIRDSISTITSRLNATASDVEVLKSKQGPKLHPVSVIAGIAAAASLVLWILDRLYT